jgi:acetyl esterase/lipase
MELGGWERAHVYASNEHLLEKYANQVPLRENEWDNRRKLDWVAGVYVSDGTPLTDPYVSPYFGDFSGLPPFLIQTGEREVLHDDGKRVVEKARNAGMDADFKTLTG